MWDLPRSGIKPPASLTGGQILHRWASRETPPLVFWRCNSSFFWLLKWHPTPVLLPGKSHGGGAWWAAVHGVAKSRTRLSDFTFTFHFHALEKEMATQSSVLAWRIPGTAEAGGLPSMGSHRVGHDWSNLAAAAWFFFMKLCCYLYNKKYNMIVIKN